MLADDDSTNGGERSVLIERAKDDSVLGFQRWPHGVALNLHHASTTTKKQQKVEKPHCC